MAMLALSTFNNYTIGAKLIYKNYRIKIFCKSKHVLNWLYQRNKYFQIKFRWLYKINIKIIIVL